VAFPTKNYYWDGLGFARQIENSTSLPDLIHPNHPLYNPFSYLLWKFALAAGLNVRAVSVMQVANSVFGALSAFTLFHILKRFLSTYLTTAFTLLFSFSSTWWKFSTDADAYIVSVLFLLISFYLVLPGQASRPFLVALTHSVAMVFHQLAVFFFPVAALGILIQSSSLPWKNRWRRVTQYGGLAFLITFGTSCVCFYAQTASLDVRRFLRWLTTYASDSGFGFNLKDNVLLTVRGHFRLFFGGRFNFLTEVINPFSVLLTLALVLASALLLIQLVRKRREIVVVTERRPEDIHRRGQLVVLCAVWAAAYFLFLFVFIPQNTFYRLFYLPPLIVLIGVLPRWSDRVGSQRRVALFTTILALSNFLFLIFPYAHVRKNTPLSLSLEMNDVWSQKTVIYYLQRNSDNDTLGYFNPTATWKRLGPHRTKKFESELRRLYASGGSAWLETSALKQIARQRGGQEWLDAHSKEQTRFMLTNRAYDVRLVQLFPR
jgi:hypothetical protein